jgi:hypothetical protein
MSDLKDIFYQQGSWQNHVHLSFTIQNNQNIDVYLEVLQKLIYSEAKPKIYSSEDSNYFKLLKDVCLTADFSRLPSAKLDIFYSKSILNPKPIEELTSSVFGCDSIQVETFQK